MRFEKTLLASAVCVYGIFGITGLNADVLVLNPVADAFVGSNNPGTNNGGDASMTLTGSNTAGQHVNAGLLEFDLSAIPAGSTINSAAFRIYVTAASGNPFFEFFSVTTAWDESEVTWNEALDGTAWTAVGGDYGSDQLGNDDILANEVGSYQVFPATADLETAVQGWLDDPSSNHGIHLRRRFGNTGQFVTFNTTDAATNRPELIIDYTPVPEPGAFALVGCGVLACASRRRHS